MPDSASKAKSCAPIAIMCPDVQGTTSMEMLVGSQKRKARKTKITHLVRTADGSVSPAEGECSFPLSETSKLDILTKISFSFHVRNTGENIVASISAVTLPFLSLAVFYGLGLRRNTSDLFNIKATGFVNVTRH